MFLFLYKKRTVVAFLASFLCFSGVDMSTPEQYRFHVYLVVNPKRELESKMAVTVGLQVIGSMHITLENPYVYVFYMSII